MRRRCRRSQRVVRRGHTVRRSTRMRLRRATFDTDFRRCRVDDAGEHRACSINILHTICIVQIGGGGGGVSILFEFKKVCGAVM